MHKLLAFAASCALASALVACGSDETPTPSPVPSPTPTAAPAPTPTPTSGGITNGVLLGGADKGDTLAARAICYGTPGFDEDGNLNGVVPFEAPFDDDNSIGIEWVATDTYLLNDNGFGGSGYGPESRVESGAFIRYVIPTIGEFQIARDREQLQFATYGLLAEDNLCFYAAAPSPASAPPETGQVQYWGHVDGYFHVGSSRDYRLYGSTARLVHQSGDDYELTLDFKGIANPWEEPDGQEITELEDFVVPLTLSEGSFGVYEGTSGGPGRKVRIVGQLSGDNHIAALILFSIIDAEGTFLFGAAALDGALI